MPITASASDKGRKGDAERNENKTQHHEEM